MNEPITLDHLRRMPMGDVAALEPVTLAGLQDQANVALERAKSIKDLLDGVLARRYADRAALLRKEIGKEHGVIRFADEGVTVIADQRKDVKWNQDRLAMISSRIQAGGGNPEEYMKLTRSVDERKYSAWPDHIRSAFAEARTVRFGKQMFRIEPNA